MRPIGLASVVALLLAVRTASAEEVLISFRSALERASRAAPDILVSRSREAIAQAEVGIAGTLPNPTLSAGTSTQAARLSLGVSLPLVILGQRGAAMEAGRADLQTARVETEMAAVDVRAQVAHAYVALWHTQRVAAEKERAAAVARHLDEAVAGRVELGASAKVDGLRSRADRLRAEAEAQQALRVVDAAGSGLGRWFGMEDGTALRAGDDPPHPPPPPFAELRSRLEAAPSVRRERSDRAAAEARIAREKALVRPTLLVDLGMDAFDQTLCPSGPCSHPPVNYRGGLGVELPLLSHRGAFIEREEANAHVAETRGAAERVRLASALSSAYRTYQASSATVRSFAEGVVPAANLAADAAEESYSLGRGPLFAVLDAERARIEAQIALLDSRALEADAWIEVERALGAP